MFMTTNNRAEAIVDLGAIKANIKHLMEISGKPALAVVKADAYGHGLVPVAKAAVEGGASWLGVALLEEALTLRANDVRAPMLLPSITISISQFLRANTYKQ